MEELLNMNVFEIIGGVLLIVTCLLCSYIMSASGLQTAAEYDGGYYRRSKRFFL